MTSESDSGGERAEQTIEVGRTVADDEEVALPVVEVLTGRGFVTGKSGSGKSNTTSVVVEELLEAGYPVLIIDTDGEYYGLKEEYEMLHAGADEECDIQIGAEHAEKVAALALEQNVPVILDVSGYLDDDEANDLIRDTARHLFAKEKKLKKPFLLVVEECHEYIPEGGGMDETGKMLIKIGKRGRKHGLGIVGISQRPADVKKDFITQANWLVWHRLTWENDTKVVGRIVGSEYGKEVPNLNAGEAFVQTDWTDGGVRRIQWKRKRTFDAGATPGLDDFERPELKSVSDALVDDLQGISELKDREENRIAELESELERKDERIASLEAELDSARDISAAARKMANALSHGEIEPDTRQTTLDDLGDELTAKDDEIRRLNEEVGRLEDELAEAEAAIEELEAGSADDGDDDATAAGGEREGDEGEGSVVEELSESEWTTDIEAIQERLRRRGERLREAEAESEDAADSTDDFVGGDDDAEINDGSEAAEEPDRDELRRLVRTEAVANRLAAARRESTCNERRAASVVDALIADGPVTVHELADAVDLSVESVYSLLSALTERSLAARDRNRRYALDPTAMRRLVAGDERSKLGELHEQWRAD